VEETMEIIGFEKSFCLLRVQSVQMIAALFIPGWGGQRALFWFFRKLANDGQSAQWERRKQFH
jgi:hypothetical protein